MAAIKFIREYNLGSGKYYDIAYGADTVSRVTTAAEDKLPATAKAFMASARATSQYDPIYKRGEILYESNVTREYRLRQVRNGKLTFANTYSGSSDTTVFKTEADARKAIALFLANRKRRIETGYYDQMIKIVPSCAWELDEPEYIIQSREVTAWE